MIGELPKPEPLVTWTLQEKWVWANVSAGDKADFNQAEGYGGKLDPKKSDGWMESRQLRQEFLEAILLREPYRSSVTRKGVCIEGAWFDEPLDFMRATIGFDVFLDRCRFEYTVFMAGLKTSGLVSFQGSKFKDRLNLNGARIENDLFMRSGAEFADVELLSAWIGGHLDLSGSKFTGELNMNNVRVEGILAMCSGAEFAEVDLVGARVVSNVDMRCSRFRGALRMNGLQARELVFSEAIFEDEVKLDSCRVESHVFIRFATFSASAPIILNFAFIGANLDLSGSTLSSVTLVGANIRGSLVFGQEHQQDHTPHPAMWRTEAKLILNDATVGALQDLESAWPNDLELEGFTYGHLGSLGTDTTMNLAMRDISWLSGWLAKQKRFSPTPYEQLATALVNAGHSEKANEILYAGRERARIETTFAWQKKVWLLLQKVLIGYGYRLRYSLYWVLVFVVLGVVILRISYQSPATGSLDEVFYSVDTLLPIIDLDERYSKILLDGWTRYYFYIHKMIGYVLTFFIIAGLAGLTKRTK